jgi:hypothetical protein
LIPVGHLRFNKGCRDYFETVRHIFVHAYYEPDRPLREHPVRRNTFCYDASWLTALEVGTGKFWQANRRRAAGQGFSRTAKTPSLGI